LAAPNALDRHIALVGFMGAGKSTLAREVALRLGRLGSDLDGMVELAAGDDIHSFFAKHGEAEFRRVEENETVFMLSASELDVVALGGGAVLSREVRDRLREHAFTVWVDVDVETAWERVRGSGRPLAQDEQQFRALYEERLPLYEEVADAKASDVDGVVLAAGGIHVGVGALERLGSFMPEGPLALVADAYVSGIHGAAAQLALGSALAEAHEVPAGEESKSLEVCERLWRALRLDRDGVVVALGGGSTTDAAGFVAAAYLRGLKWVAVPTTIVGQVDAAIGGKTGVNLPEGKNLVGAFHWPVRTVIDPGLLATLPEEERVSGLAEVVKTGLLAGEPVWQLPEPELVRRCAAFKTAICIRDPHEQGERVALNLGHTFAHALEAASDYRLSHGEAVALGLLASLRLSGLPTDVVDEVLSPQPARVDRKRAWAALARDKKAANGRPRLVLLDRPGVPRTDVELPDREIRSALDALIRD
jgi:shikimate kinase/3-dehydroquinate synthase